MDISHVALVLFGTFSALRIISYVPQIHKVAADRNGASAISYSTWSLWTAANVATALYATVNLQDRYLASVSIIYAVCCVIVICLTFFKRRRFQGPCAAKPEPLGWRVQLAGPGRKMGVALGGLLAITMGLGAGVAFPGRIAEEHREMVLVVSTEAVNSAAADEPIPATFAGQKASPQPVTAPVNADRPAVKKRAGEPRRRAAPKADRYANSEWRQFVGAYGIKLDD